MHKHKKTDIRADLTLKTFQDGTISASEAWEYGNLTLAEFLKADKDQDGFIIPSEFDSDLA